MQAEESSTKTLHQLINCLYSSQQIDRNLINNLQIAEQPQLSCYFGLINLLYNIICEKHRDFRLALEERKNTQVYKKGKLLQIQGQILRNYVNLAYKFLPGPAFYLASFDFLQFNNYCMKRGLVQLIRQSTGLYPLIDTAKTPVLQFLPFYQQFKQGQGSLIGNQNWQTARKSLQTFYDLQIKQGQGLNNTTNSNNTKINVQELDDDKVDSETKQKNAIRLCYMILAGRKYEIKEYIAMLTDFYVLNRQQQDENVAQIQEMIRKFAIWYQNYSKFMEDGLKLYQGELQSNIQLFHGGAGDTIQQIIIRLIQQISQFHLASVQGQSNQKIQSIRLDLQKLMEFSKQLGEHQNLFICYLHVIGKKIQLEPPLNTNKFYVQANGNSVNSKNQEAFNRIMFSDTELIQLYEKDELTNFPSSYNFGNQLLVKFLRIICNKNDSKASLNLERFEIFSSNAEKLRILVGSKKLSQFSADKAKNESEQIINYIKKNAQAFSKQLVSYKGQMIEQKKAKQLITTFIQQWELFYRYMKQFNFDFFYQLMKNYEKNEEVQRVQLKRNNEKVHPGQFNMPLRNPYVVYRIVNKFVEEAKNAKQKYLTCFELCQSKLKQAAIQNQYLQSKGNLEKCIQLFKNSIFRDMVYFSDPEPGNKQKKQDYEDQIWKQYAEIILIFPENWWSQAKIQPQQNQLTTRRSPQSQEQKPNMDEMIDEDDQYVQEIQEDEMEDQEEDEDEDEYYNEGEDSYYNEEGYDRHDD